jgi:hypothetical protein
MKIVHAHAIAKLCVSTANFQQKAKIGNLLQHVTPKFPKMHVVRDLIVMKVLVAKEICDLKTRDNFPFPCKFFSL